MAAPRPPGIALVSREMYPFGGGIGEYIASCARLLATVGDITIFTSSLHETALRKLIADDDPHTLPPGVQVVFVPEPDPGDLRGHFSPLHLYSARVLEALRQRYGSHPPRLVEFSDYLGEGAVTAQARRAGDPLLRATRVGVRLHTSAEVCSILDGFLDPDFEQRITYELERIALRDADFILWPGGDTFEFYKRFYGSALAPPKRIRNPFWSQHIPSPEQPRDPAAPLRLLFLGRLERRKGVQDLLRAVTSIESDDVQLTLLGGDTHTAPLATSMRAQLELVAAGDHRIEFLDAVPRSELDRVIQAHDTVVLPSLWEAWPYVGLEALRLNRPLITTSTGGFTEMVRPGVSGWRTDRVGADRLTTLIEQLILDRDAVDRLRLEGLPGMTFAELTDATEILDAYDSLLSEPARWDLAGVPPQPAPDISKRAAVEPVKPKPPLVSVVIPYYGLHEHVGETVESIFAQTYPRLEVIIVNDGSFFEADWVLGELAARYPLAVLTQMNAGLGAARNFGIGQSRGRYIVPMDADNMLEPTFVERGVALLESQPDLAYVTTWSRYVDEEGIELNPPDQGYAPLGNLTELARVANVAGDATSVIRRRLFDLGFAYSHDLTSFEDWSFYRELGENGHEGLVVPERLFRYRVRPESMLREIGASRENRLIREINTHLTEGKIEWT
jgi:glycogen synthase